LTAKKLNILIIEGSQKPQVFVENLINGLLDEGMQVCLLGKDSHYRFIPKPSRNFSRIITHYGKFNALRLLAEFALLLLVDINAVRKASNYLTESGGKQFKFKTWITFAKILHKKPDILHFQWPMHMTAYEKIIMDSLFKVVVSFRGSQINVTPVVDLTVANFYRRIFPLVNGFHAVSNSIAIKGIAIGADASKTSIIHSLLDPLLSSSRKRIFRYSPLKLIAIGRFHWIKCYNYLLDALGKLKTLGYSIKLTLIAQGDMPEEILFQLHDLNLNSEVEWVNGLPHSLVLQKMEEHDVMVLPSVEEGIANVVLEAMMIGLPVISTDCGGMKEVIKNGENGFLVPVRDPQAITDAIIKFSQLSDDEIKIITKRAQLTIDQYFNKEQSVKEFIKLYQKVVQCA
jgi:glycosyltransferase involved in cell wall biosynthesis